MSAWCECIALWNERSVPPGVLGSDPKSGGGSRCDCGRPLMAFKALS